eukprot:TRINITY_DN11228_c0_g2_i1.p1 TRINITY_DN11228_c0_g2~~TRINITY_DN11228_c0_g2_i1.p1  ORF type:complete len:600 (+),score=58.33 TRINITY_DN11228_c0_g2_i1:48-1847(+)
MTLLEPSVRFAQASKKDPPPRFHGPQRDSTCSPDGCQTDDAVDTDSFSAVASSTKRLQEVGWFGRIILSSRFETLGGFVVLLNFVVMTIETHARAVRDTDLLAVIAYINQALLLFYIFECVSRIYLFKARFFLVMWNNLDLFIVITGLISEVLKLLDKGTGGSIKQLGVMKNFRMLRLLRLARIFVAFKELYILIAGLARCLKTLFWASGLIMIFINAWSIVSVEYMASITKELDAAGEYTYCSWCGNAFSNMWLANLTWFQIVSGDGWSVLARSIVEKYPWTFLFFVTNIFIVVWGLLNLIVAAIVEASIAAREEDVSISAKLVARFEEETHARFQALCKTMDSDGSGAISIHEFREVLKESKELQEQLVVMGVHDEELECLLELMAKDGDGVLANSEFVDQFTQMRTLIVKTQVFYLVKYVKQMHAELREHSEILKSLAAAQQEAIPTKDRTSVGTEQSARSPILSEDVSILASHFDKGFDMLSSQLEQISLTIRAELRGASSVDKVAHGLEQVLAQSRVQPACALATNDMHADGLRETALRNHSPTPCLMSGKCKEKHSEGRLRDGCSENCRCKGDEVLPRHAGNSSEGPLLTRRV